MTERKKWSVIDFYYKSGYEKGRSSRTMPTVTDNHKGERCPYKEILCQEGYCSECQVYLDYIEYCKSLWD